MLYLVASDVDSTRNSRLYITVQTYSAFSTWVELYLNLTNSSYVTCHSRAMTGVVYTIDCQRDIDWRQFPIISSVTLKYRWCNLDPDVMQGYIWAVISTHKSFAAWIKAEIKLVKRTDTAHSRALRCSHYSDVIMTTVASQITSLTVVYSIVYSGAEQRKHQSSASLAFVRGIHRNRWIPRTKGQ